MDDERLTIELVVKNSEGKQTAGLMLGEMKLEDVLKIEAEILTFFAEKVKQQLTGTL